MEEVVHNCLMHYLVQPGDDVVVRGRHQHQCLFSHHMFRPHSVYTQVPGIMTQVPFKPLRSPTRPSHLTEKLSDFSQSGAALQLFKRFYN